MAEMYEWAGKRLERAGFVQYEISNWAKLESSGEIHSCKHNLQYWRNLSYIGLGAGAHGFANWCRTENTRGIEEYIQRMEGTHQRVFPLSPANELFTPIDRWTEIQETMMVGLRMVNEGVSRAGFMDRFGVSLETYFDKEIHTLIGSGLLEYAGRDGDILRLTERGRFISNQVFMRFIGKKNPEEG
jgi:oxygen-independent coproporphyrinogen III oxidase